MDTKPWETEPDELDFEAFGLPCALRRGPVKAWCGYVGIPTKHPLHGLGYSSPIQAPKSLLNRVIDKTRISAIAILCTDSEALKRNIVSLELCFDVHGGLTWASDHAGGPSHKDKGYWWFGFDCAHAGDLSPSMDASKFGQEDYIYRDLAYAKEECRDLARQLAGWKRSLSSQLFHFIKNRVWKGQSK